MWGGYLFWNYFFLKYFLKLMVSEALVYKFMLGDGVMVEFRKKERLF